VEYASILLIGNFGNGYLLTIGGQHAKIVNLAATGRVESRTVKNYGMFALKRERFDHASVEVVEKRIVVVESFSHWASAFSLQHSDFSY